jgi:hypothetical protein
MDISDKTSITIPLRNLIALIAFTIVSVSGYVNMVGRLTALEHAQNLKNTEISMNSEFRIKWPRGELGALPEDAEQNLRLNYLEKNYDELSSSVEKLKAYGTVNFELKDKKYLDIKE